MTNEDEIKKEVYSRQHKLNVAVDWLTPSGRRRSVPMYHATIKNEYLKDTRVIKGHSTSDVLEKAKVQLERWNESEIRGRLGGVVKGIREEIESVNAILENALKSECGIRWQSRIEKTKFKDFSWSKPQPDKPAEPAASFFEFLFKSWKRQREEAWAKTLQDWAGAVKAWEEEKKAARLEYEKEKGEYEAKQLQHNEAIADLLKRLESGDPDAIVEHVRESLEHGAYPDCFARHYEVHFEAPTTTLVVDVSLPEQKSIPDVVEVKYREKNFKRSHMKATEHDELYDSAIKKCVLRTIFEAFQCTNDSHVGSVVLNGWVTSVDEATGNEVTSCIVSVSTERKQFETFNLHKVEPSKCIAGLKGLIAGPLSQLAPVKPIFQLKRDDKRFIESKDVLAEYNSTTNLAEIPWEDFEQIVRELFGKMFSTDGAEVRVTQASRDGGVDAIAFDPDPIRGGKFVIQAKRYTNVVGVSAVRDLYGTMINEGAVKGILVTTAHFGPDSREFSKDKPITLIDGANLVYLLEKYGKKVRIDIEAARRHRTEDDSKKD